MQSSSLSAEASISNAGLAAECETNLRLGATLQSEDEDSRLLHHPLTL